MPPFEPVGAYGNQQIDPRDTWNSANRFSDTPKQIDSRRVGLTGFVGSNEIVATDVPIGERAACRRLNRSGDAQQSARWPVPTQGNDRFQAFGGSIRIEGE